MNQRKKNLNSRVLENQIRTFCSNKDHNLGSKTEKEAEVDNAGFVTVLRGGMKSTGRETLSVIMPQDIDLSIRQNDGFSLFFWVITSKPYSQKSNRNQPDNENSSSKDIRYIIKKGGTVDQLTPTIGLSGSHLFVQLTTSKTSKETIYANKSIDYGHFYSVAVTFFINYEQDSTEISIYLDGKLDAQTSVMGEPVHNQGYVFLGKPDGVSKGFRGTVADVIIVPSVLQENEIVSIHENGLESILYSDGTALETEGTIRHAFERKRLIKKYAFYTKKPISAVENLGLSNNQMRDVVMQYDRDEIPPPVKEEHVDERIENMRKNMKDFMDDEDNEIKTYKIQDNAQFLNTIFYLCNNEQDLIEFDRVVHIFKVLTDMLGAYMDKNFILTLSSILYSYDKKENFINTSIFFGNLFRILDEIENIRANEEIQNAKFETKSKKEKDLFGNKRKIQLSAKERAEMRRTQREQNYQYQTKPVSTFGNCIPEHENLMLGLQKTKNVVDEEDERNLKNFQSNFIIKSLYEKPKNLPGENPECPEPEVLDNSQSVLSNQSEEDGAAKRELTQEQNNALDEFIEEIFEQETNPIRLSNGVATTKGEAEEKHNLILSYQRELQRREEEKERKRREEEERRRAKEREAEEEAEPVKPPTAYDPKYPENWAEGAIEVVINHCYNCYLHTTTTKGSHHEKTFVDKFNLIGESIKKIFPNSNIIANLDKREYFGNFDVYLRGTGLPSDEFGRYFIFRKCDAPDLRFPEPYEITDTLVALSIVFGSSINLQNSQMKLIKRTKIPSVIYDNKKYRKYEELRDNMYVREYPEDFPSSNVEREEEIKKRTKNGGSKRRGRDPAKQ